jgi:uncharacterized phage infection (PIP) family protein YhgE
VEGTLSELSVAFEDYTHIVKQGNDEVVITLERLLDPLRRVDQQSKKTTQGIEGLSDSLSKTNTNQKRYNKDTEGLGRSTKGLTRAF